MSVTPSKGITWPAGIVWRPGEDALLKPQSHDVITFQVHNDPASPGGFKVQILDVQWGVKPEQKT